jgi:hypothetical protein
LTCCIKWSAFLYDLVICWKNHDQLFRIYFSILSLMIQFLLLFRKTIFAEDGRCRRNLCLEFAGFMNLNWIWRYCEFYFCWRLWIGGLYYWITSVDDYQFTILTGVKTEKDMFLFIILTGADAKILYMLTYISLFVCLSLFLVSSYNAVYKVQSGSSSQSPVRNELNLLRFRLWFSSYDAVAQGASLRS